MKKIIFTICAFTLCSIGFVEAQTLDTIPNGGFDRWNGIGKAKECPQLWDTFAHGGPAFPVTDVEYETQSLSTSPVFNDKYVWDGGKYALSLTSSTVGNLVYVGEVECKFKVKHQDPYIILNMAYFEAGGPQSPIFDVTFWNSKTHDTVCNTGLLFLPYWNTQADTFQPWSTLNIPLAFNYENHGLLPSSTDTTTPDSCHIIITNAIPANGIGSAATPSLYIERMWFAEAAATAGINLGDNHSAPQNTCQAYPNPFTNKTTIHYNLVQDGQVNLSIYDMQGREIKNLVDGNESSGLYNQVFDGSGLSNGVYMYRLETSSGVQTGKLILSK